MTDPQPGQAPDPIIAAVQRDLAARSRLGMMKYGIGLNRTDLSHRQWLQHAYEECLDMAGYLKATMTQLDAQETDNGR